MGLTDGSSDDYCRLMGEDVGTVRARDDHAHHQPRRAHAVLRHTADVGLRATALDCKALFEEAAAGLAELSADVIGSVPRQPLAIEVGADDLEQLAFGWLNEIIGVADDRGEALVDCEVVKLEAHENGYMLRGRAWFAPFDGHLVRPRMQVKAATMHRLRVARTKHGWELEAYLDV